MEIVLDGPNERGGSRRTITAGGPAELSSAIARQSPYVYLALNLELAYHRLVEEVRLGGQRLVESQPTSWQTAALSALRRNAPC